MVLQRTQRQDLNQGVAVTQDAEPRARVLEGSLGDGIRHAAVILRERPPNFMVVMNWSQNAVSLGVLVKCASEARRSQTYLGCEQQRCYKLGRRMSQFI